MLDFLEKPRVESVSRSFHVSAKRRESYRGGRDFVRSSCAVIVSPVSVYISIARTSRFLSPGASFSARSGSTSRSFSRNAAPPSASYSALSASRTPESPGAAEKSRPERRDSI